MSTININFIKYVSLGVLGYGLFDRAGIGVC